MKRKSTDGTKVISSGPYAHVVEAGDFFYFAGQTGYNGSDYDGQKYSISKQTKLAFSFLEDVMNQVGVSFDQVVKVNVYLTSMDYFKEMNDIYASYFEKPYPARTCVAVVGLPLEADVEIEFTVYKGK